MSSDTKVPEVREALSWVPLKVKPYAKGRELSTATGFFYRHNARSFLITNYHVVSDRDPDTGSLRGRAPDALVLGVPCPEEREGDRRLIQWKWRTLPLYSADGARKPVWSEHPQHGRRFDVVAIPVSGLEETRVKAANDPKLGLDSIRLYPSMDVFVLGYPFGISGGGHFPIWKRATIATEPDLDLDGLPKLYIDTATQEGMSGAPVYAQEVGYWLPEGKTCQAEAVIGKGRRFIGVYSSRVGSDSDLGVQLGTVWKESALISLLESVPPEDDG